MVEKRFFCILLIIILFWQTVYSARPETTYSARSYYNNIFSIQGNAGSFSAIGQEIAFISTTFDEEVYLTLDTARCFANVNVTETEYQSCPPRNASDPIICIDSNSSFPYVLKNETEFTIYQSKVLNPHSCSFVAFSYSPLFGDPDFIFDTTKYSATATTRDQIIGKTPRINNVYQFISQNGLIRCCSEILRGNPNWDGTINWALLHNNLAAYRINPHPVKSLVPLSNWYWNVTLSIACTIDNFTCYYPCNATLPCCPGFSVTYPSIQPFFNYLWRGNTTQLLQPEPNMIQSKIILSEISSGSSCNYFPKKRLPHCYIGYSNIYDTYETVMDSSNTRLIESPSPDCDYGRYTQISKEFDAQMLLLNEVTGSNNNEVASIISTALAIITGDDWQGCLQNAQNILSPIFNVTTTKLTKVCNFDLFDSKTEWESDPCCNLTLGITTL